MLVSLQHVCFEDYPDYKLTIKYINNKKLYTMGINANKKVKRRKVRINGNKNSTNNWGITAAGWNAVHKAIINAED
mgnify:CR=1 FL=1